MCNAACLAWATANLQTEEVRNKRVLEVGAYDVNGSLRPAVEAMHPAEYIGADMRRGPGVDCVCRAEHLVDRFGPNRFDLVICLNTLEHIRAWQSAISNLKHICQPTGILLAVMPSQWGFHAYPGDYWRYTPTDIAHIFSDCQVLVLAEDPAPPALVYAKIQKPPAFVENDLAGYPLYSILAGRRVAQIRAPDFFSPRLAGLLAQALLQEHLPPSLFGFCLKVKMGLKLKLSEPLIKRLRQP